MSKAFVKESELEEALPEAAPAEPAGAKNYISPAGYARLKAELKQLVEVERPEVVRTVSWAAANGDRSENGDYIYGKKRLREIDRRVRFLIKRLENAEVVASAGRDRSSSVPPSRCAPPPAPSACSGSSAPTRWMRGAAACPGMRRSRARCSRRAPATR
jgi:hypothetical protein